MKEPIVPGYTVEKIQEFAENKITKKGIGTFNKNCSQIQQTLAKAS